MRKVVVGVGNPHIPEDSFGVKVAEMAKKAGFDALAAFPLDLPEMLEGYDFAIVVDVLLGKKTGEIHLLSVEDLKARKVFTSHSIGVMEAIMLGFEYAEMPEILIVAVEVGEKDDGALEKALSVVMDVIAYEMCRR
ncbi:hydrogenase maturation protease [Archaeoglobus fulgidus]|uniref:Hydrogenase maturation protease n=1 Tax=Archaeoglobus fulgidus DSM 8774 TaxID=1344584 RepID=A0A075WCX2_ARCFL|nr:hydrogenase maturation protease [Archaeoglobus fulgidus]AIG98250.1 hydrogenase maturation protease [Archaeoglobus fulgidus DSM 8774]